MDKAVEILTNDPKANMISIASSKERFGPNACSIDQNIFLNAPNCLLLFFDDIWNKSQENYGRTISSYDEIRSVLEWVKDRDDINVHCKMGISRSSAIAYIIACSRMDPKKAIKILNPNIHSPNILIIKQGAEILKDPSIVTEFVKYENSNIGMFTYNRFSINKGQ